jgi:small GTP-binding protein
MSTSRVSQDKAGEGAPFHLRVAFSYLVDQSDSVAWSWDGKQIASGSDDKRVRVWEAGSGELVTTLEGHEHAVMSVAWSPDGKQIASGSADYTVRVWEGGSGKLVRKLEGHENVVQSVGWSPDGKQIASGSGDNTVCVWEAGSGELVRTLEGHEHVVMSVAWSPDGKQIASGSYDNRVRLWEAGTGKLVTTLEGHEDAVQSVAWSPDGKQVASGSSDKTVRVWEAGGGKLVRTLEGHEDVVKSVAWSPDGKQIASGSYDNRIRVWESGTGHCLQDFDSPDRFVDLAFRPAQPIAPFFRHTRLGDPDIIAAVLEISPGVSTEGSMQIVNAKIVLVGESDVGKSGLALRLAEDRFEDQVSTHGMRLWPMPPEKLSPALASPEGEKREVVLWDLGGQDEYRLVHQLFLYDTTIALMLLDPTRDGHFDDIDEWNLRLEKRLRGHAAARLLVGAKADTINKDLIDKTRIDGLVAKWQMKSFCLTSAKENTGISELRDLIAQSIDWADLSRTSRPRLFQRIREAVDNLRRKGEVVVLYSELDKQIKASEPGEFAPSAVNTVVEQLARQGAITDTRLSTGDRALILQIGYVEIYAGSLILIARENSRARGVPAIELSDAVFRRTFPGIKDGERLPALQERSVIECVVELMIENGICLKHERLLVFPTLFPETAAEEDEGAKRAVSLFYDFSGAVDNIYSALVAQLAVGERFGRVRLWRNRAEFDRPGQGVCGLHRIDRPGGWSHLDLLFGEETSKETRDLFTAFVEDHLRKEGVTIREVLEMDCRKCGYRFDESLVSDYIAAGLAELPCPRPLCNAVNPISEGAAKSRSGSPAVAGEMLALRRKIDEKKSREVAEAKRQTKTPRTAAAPVRILHLSDLHLDEGADPAASLQPLARDLKDRDGGLGLDSLDYLVVSGDLTNRASPEEFEKAHEFLSALMGRFDLSPARCVIVPGNHDLSWEVEGAYRWLSERKVDAAALAEGSYVRQGNGHLIRDDAVYPRRFENFNKFYHQLMQQPYSLKPEAQCVTLLFDERRIQFLAMNSAWQIDEYFPDRSGINQSARPMGCPKRPAKSRRQEMKGASTKRLPSCA